MTDMHRIRQFALAVVTIPLLSLIAGCGDTENTEGQSEPEWTRLPAEAGIATCSQNTESPPAEEWACEWSRSFDAMIIAEIDAVEPAKSPSIRSTAGPDPELLDECDPGSAEPVPSLDVTVVESIYGEFEPNDELTVRFGMRPGFSPFLFIPMYEGINLEDNPEAIEDDDDFHPDDVEWVRREDYLKPGTRVGFGLHHHQEPVEAWSSTGEPMFTFEGGEVNYQPGAFQCVSAPLPDSNFEEFSTTVRGCPTTDAAAERRDLIVESASESPQEYVAAICYGGDSESN